MNPQQGIYQKIDKHQMAWNPSSDGSPAYLVIRYGPDSPWLHYRHTSYCVPDHPISNGSLGYATMQKALKMGVEMIPHPNKKD